MPNSNTETRTDHLSSSDKAQGNEEKNKAKIKIHTEGGESREIEVTNGHMAYLSPEEFTIIGHDTDDGEDHVLFDKRIRLPLDEAMIENIRTHGVITPILCRRIGQGPLLVIDGQRRVRHAREFNRRVKEGLYEETYLIKVPFMIRSPGTDSVHIGRRISLNEVRMDNGPLEKADLVQKLESFGMSDDEIAVTMGCTKMSVSNYRTLNVLPPEVRASLINNKISVSQALHIAKVDEKHRADALRMYEAADGSSFQQKRHQIRQMTEGVAPEKTTPAPTKRLLRSMITTAESGEYKAPADMVYVIKWILGDIPSNDVAGKSLGLLDWFEFAKKQKDAKKSEKDDADSAEKNGKKKGKGKSKKVKGEQDPDAPSSDESDGKQGKKGKKKGKGKSKKAKGEQDPDAPSSDESDGKQETKGKKGKKGKKKAPGESGTSEDRAADTSTLPMFPDTQVNSEPQSDQESVLGSKSKASSRRSDKKK